MIEMASIGIIANPASGKDIRRLVSYATVFDNNEKLNIVKRIVLAAQGMGIEDIWFMPDSFQTGYKVIDDLSCEMVLTARCRILEMNISASAQDSTDAAALMESMGLGCIVVLGGDGTSRAVAKSVKNIPVLPVSTGTNNVYPLLIEGTVAGMAAAAAAMAGDEGRTCVRDKRIEVFMDGCLKDIALIDAVVSAEVFVGARAIWNLDNIMRVMVTRCHPASIGFSSVAGVLGIVRPWDDFGYSVVLGDSGMHVVAPIAAGVLKEVCVSHAGRMELDEEHSFTASGRCVIALDGEREIVLREGETVVFKITRNGPLRVDVRSTLEKALNNGVFSRGT